MSIAEKKKGSDFYTVLYRQYKTAEIASQEDWKDQIAKLIFLRTKKPTQPHLNP